MSKQGTEAVITADKMRALSEEEIDGLVVAEANVNEAWSEPIYTQREPEFASANRFKRVVMAKKTEQGHGTSTVIMEPVAEIEPRTELGAALAKIRARIVASGVASLLSDEEIDRETAARRILHGRAR